MKLALSLMINVLQEHNDTRIELWFLYLLNKNFVASSHEVWSIYGLLHFHLILPQEYQLQSVGTFYIFPIVVMHESCDSRHSHSYGNVHLLFIAMCPCIHLSCMHMQGWLQGYAIGGGGVKANLTNLSRSVLRFDQLESVIVEV